MTKNISDSDFNLKNCKTQEFLYRKPLSWSWEKLKLSLLLNCSNLQHYKMGNKKPVQVENNFFVRV
jgi:hypothetical protein